MPWTPNEFRRKHNKKLTLAQAGKAASIAEAMMRSGADEGMAIATANKRAKAMAKIVRRRERQLAK